MLLFAARPAPRRRLCPAHSVRRRWWRGLRWPREAHTFPVWR